MSGDRNTSSIDFFESVFTSLNESATVTCCHVNNTVELTSCGLGASCEGSCSALGASLCPSGDCSGDCEMPFESNEVETRSRSSATRPSNAFKWCSPRCNVWRHHGCCYNPVCNRKRRRACRWINFLTGGSVEENQSDNLLFIQGRLVLFLAVCPMEVGPDSRDVKSRNNYFFRPQNNKNVPLLLISAQTVIV